MSKPPSAGREADRRRLPTSAVGQHCGHRAWPSRLRCTSGHAIARTCRTARSGGRRRWEVTLSKACPATRSWCDLSSGTGDVAALTRLRQPPAACRGTDTGSRAARPGPTQARRGSSVSIRSSCRTSIAPPSTTTSRSYAHNTTTGHREAPARPSVITSRGLPPGDDPAFLCNWVGGDYCRAAPSSWRRSRWA